MAAHGGGEVETFTTCGSIVTHTIPASGDYRIVAVGAKAIDYTKKGRNQKGGRGAEMQATFVLRQGDVLHLLVGATSKQGQLGTGGAGVRACHTCCPLRVRHTRARHPISTPCFLADGGSPHHATPMSPMRHLSVQRS